MSRLEIQIFILSYENNELDHVELFGNC